ncbi:MAG: HNH endonuclease [Gammaproteobacteria bacterium]|nr:HNH endonuclease [Gammaproteobacteria bacterium]CAJ2377152.1 MAG: HNHc domain-containing protein [Arenicellales bacterium IbO2]MDA7961208.1 HNH endonuclease [Gammaproteobacteria bacterium]MDA7970851.1 HNH endonuclease [Gammaproteobacteria bacterium]MDA7994689.1 HNH endonuclease [Gammaproteobacteria bacterium]
MNIKPSTIFTADNLDILRGIDSECVDLIYLDPPFNSNKNYSAPVGSKAAGAHFKDTWSLSDTDDAWWGQIADKYPDLYRVIDAVGAVGGNSNKSYCIYMAMRLLEMHRILKPTGSIYYHCDPTMSHSIKLLMDAIFGTAQFRNEIVWCYKGAETATRRFSSKHDLLLLYTKTKNYTYNMQYHEHSKAQLARYNVVKADGSRWANMKGKLRKLGPGKRISDWWLINVLTNNDKEREGYPTQKPLQLLRRVVLASSNPGDLVLDPFCGCATACVAAEIEGREWVGIDISAMAYSLIKRRFKKTLPKLDIPTTHHWDSAVDGFPVRSGAQVLSKDIKHTLFGRQMGKCNGCFTEFPFRHLEKDHYIPRAKGGPDIDDNLQLLCSSCNSIKGRRPMDVLYAEHLKNGIITRAQIKKRYKPPYAP